MQTPLEECAWIVDVGVAIPSAYTFCAWEKAEENRLQAENQRLENIETYMRFITEYPDSADYWKSCLERQKSGKYEIMSWEEFHRREREAILAGAMTEITAEQFNDALDALPPLRWVNHGGVEMFCCREMWTGTYTTQYARDHKTGKYYSKMVDACDPSTWIDKILMAQACA